MIFTIGKTDQYEPYIASDKDAAKAKGGTVWQSGLEAAEYLLSHDLSNFTIYGIDADWDMDVETDPENDRFYRLKRDAKLIRL